MSADERTDEEILVEIRERNLRLYGPPVSPDEEDEYLERTANGIAAMRRTIS